jgi:hypothetical protein
VNPDEIRIQLEIFEADMIADFMAMTDTHESSEHKRQRLKDACEAAGLFLVLCIGIVCLITGFAGLAADLIMIIPNGTMLAYRHLKDI